MNRSILMSLRPTQTESLDNMLGYHLKITSQGVTLSSQYVDSELAAFYRARAIAKKGDRVRIYESYRCADRWDDQEIVQDIWWEGDYYGQ